jgi:hypothetical protein
MPQATDEQRREWNGPGDETALAYLKEAGYTLTRRWTWLPPRGHTPTMKECSAISPLSGTSAVWTTVGFGIGQNPNG